MKIYVFASFILDGDPERLKKINDWLATGFKQFAKGDVFLNITTSDVSLLNDVRRIVGGKSKISTWEPPGRSGEGKRSQP